MEEGLHQHFLGGLQRWKKRWPYTVLMYALVRTSPLFYEEFYVTRVIFTVFDGLITPPLICAMSLQY